ncbi:MAG: aspartate--tRNA ligase [Spirochaetales bacterium]|nr:aspartate--tRNA ligase [Spirochaetales bacterium]
MKRTHTCGELNASFENSTVILNGWVHKNRNHGGVHFINVRDRYGITQVVIDEDATEELKAKAEGLKFEYCIAITGVVRKRPAEMVNPKMSTGDIEVKALDIEVLNTCEVLPFMVSETESDAKEDLRLKYRYIDLRSKGMQDRIRLRHEVAFATREFLIGDGFYEIETPTLIKATPEGARDFVVPSRIHPGKFFALPQSPQLYKQILMVSGFDKYFQIARCYRDEDPRGDRQLEFTQVDLEMSFVSADDVYDVVERMMKHIFAKTMNVELAVPFRRISYHQALNSYGSDKPDLRFGMEFVDFDAIASDCGFSVFKDAVANGGNVKAIKVDGAAESYSRKKITELEDQAKIYGAKGLAWMKVAGGKLDGGVSKFFEDKQEEILSLFDAKDGDLLLFMADSWKVACTALGAVRVKVAKDLGLIDPMRFEFAWINDFPLFEWNEDEQKWDPAHHMFSMPKPEFLSSIKSNPGAVLGDIYDLVCNGYELASGSIRVHNPEIQQEIFDVVGFPKEEAEKRFGFLLNAFRYGAPPHGGIAPGLDRLIMIMSARESIKDVIAFPKNNNASSPMDESPAEILDEQINELHLRVVEEDK